MDSEDEDQILKTPPNDHKNKEVAASSTNFVLPDFWMHNPELWFKQVESTFKSNKINNDSNRFDFVVSKLPPTQIELISDIIVNRDCNKNDNYTSVKDAIISRNNPSSTTLFERLLNENSMGDRKPSVHYRKIKEIARKCSITDEKMIKTFWLRALPTDIKAIISVVEDQDVNKLTMAADKAYEMIKPRPSVDALSALPTNMNNMIETITRKVTENLRREFHHQGGQNFRSRSRFRSPGPRVHFQRSPSNRSSSVNSRLSRSNSRSHSNDGYCYYHRRYGKSANKCRKNCRFPQSTLTKN